MNTFLLDGIFQKYADLKEFLDSVVVESLSSAAAVVGEQQRQREIASRCLTCFVSNGLTSKQAVAERCEAIHSDDLALTQAKVPLALVANIYRTIHAMRTPPPPSDVRTHSYLSLDINNFITKY